MTQENKLTDFFKTHLWKFAIALSLFVLLALALDRFTHKKEMSPDFLAIRTLFERYWAGEPLSNESLETIEKIIATHSELQPEYEACLALSFIQRENNEKALAFASQQMKKIASKLPPSYREYSENTLVMLQGNYPQAYVNATLLEEKLKSDPSQEELRAFNLLRLAFLAKHLGNKEVEKSSFETLTQLNTYSTISPLFQSGSFSLTHYFNS